MSMDSSKEEQPGGKKYVLRTLLAIMLLSAFVLKEQIEVFSRQAPSLTCIEGGILQKDPHHASVRRKAPANATLPPKLRVAFAITVTKDGPYADGAAVLGESIRRSCGGPQFQAFAYDLLAITHDNVTNATVTQLERFGWHIWRRPLPVPHEEMQSARYRETVEGAGCCGALEFLKLYAYVMHAYHRVMLLDMDALVTGCLDPIFMEDAELLFTPDYTMCQHCVVGSETVPPPTQGGFLVIRPNQNTFIGLNDLVRRGVWSDGDEKGHGWNHTGIGWYWGGRTIQGILPFYYTKIARGQAKALDHCIYNNMNVAGCDNTTMDQIQSLHFTACQKPWDCWAHSPGVLCHTFHERWFDVRELLEDRVNITRGARNTTSKAQRYCKEGTYDPIPWETGKPLSRAYHGGLEHQ